MTNKKTTKKALFSSAMSLILCFAMFLGTTFAWFTDSVTSAGNKIQAGTLDIDLFHSEDAATWTEITDSSAPIFDYDKWEPGYTDVNYLKLVNNGTLALKWQAMLETDAQVTALANVIDVYVVANNTGVTKAEDFANIQANWAKKGTLADFISGFEGATYGTLEKQNDAAYLGIALHMQETAGNEYQGMSLGGEFDIVIKATQLTYEKDSFDDQYDVGAYLPLVKSVDELKSALQNGDSVSLAKDFSLTEPLEVAKDATLDLNGQTLSAEKAQVFEVSNGATLNIKNGTITTTANGADKAIYATNSTAGTTTTVNLDNVDINLGTPDYDNELANNIYANAEAGNVVVNINKGTSITTKSEHHTPVYVGKNAAVNLNGGEISVENIDNEGAWTCTWAVFLSDDSAVFTMNDGVINVTGDHSSSGIYVNYCAPTININGGTINVTTTGGYGIAIEAYRNQTTQKGATLNLNGGVINVMAAAGTAGEAIDGFNGGIVNLSENAVINVYSALWSNNIAYAISSGATINGEATVNNIAVSVSTTSQLLDAVKNATVGEENIIWMTNGNYDGDIKLTVAEFGTGAKGDLLFKAMPGTKPVITGTVVLGYYQKQAGAAKWQGKVTFEGITFDHAEENKFSLDVQSVQGMNLINCTIISNGEYGLTGSANNDCGNNSRFVGCTFKNAALQLFGQFANGLVIDNCTFTDARVNVQGGVSVAVKNCIFENTLTDANKGDSFYVIRTQSIPIEVSDCKIKIDSTVTGVAEEQLQWGVLWNRGNNTNWTVKNVAITLTDAALEQTELDVIKCADKNGNPVTGKINTTNMTINGVQQ